MTRNDQRKGFLKGTVLGVAAGAALGAVAGILFAPKSGKQTREDIAKALDKGGQELSRRIDEVKRVAVNVQDRAGGDAKRLLEKAAALKDSMGKSAVQLLDKTKDESKVAKRDAQKLVWQSKKLARDLKVLADKAIKKD